jgi:hypothetical protein
VPELLSQHATNKLATMSLAIGVRVAVEGKASSGTVAYVGPLLYKVHPSYSTVARHDSPMAASVLLLFRFVCHCVVQSPDRLVFGHAPVQHCFWTSNSGLVYSVAQAVN